MNDKTRTHMILKYGSIPEAYDAWKKLSFHEQYQTFATPEYAILMEYEYDMQAGSPGPFEPR